MKPFVHEIRVRWADCDPAKIVYTGNIPMFALEAIEAWWEAHLGADWYRMNIDRDIGTPFVHLSVDFRSPVTPRHLLECSVAPLRIGESSIRFRVIGRQDGTVCFEGEFVEVFVAAQAHQKIPVPAEFRDSLEALVTAAQQGS
ncbi:acyl-CoA thioesterase [Salaquimonas pukyongi]|uniref:acyl-CoA thioesterase n=1 Tax=Salaquimonas pukyongi TaxID=2712698 RepID=UPI00096B8431|nr:thioesterase family protein [Salaquimonas pukyongi]